MTNLDCKYLLGACYSCQRCLYCFDFPQEESCKCDKNKQPSRTKHPKRGQQIYQRTFTPDSSFPKANKYMSDANDKFGYNSNFEKTFSFTLCSACNSQIQRHRSADKKDQQAQLKENDKKVAPSNLSNDDEVEDHQTISLVSSETEEEEDVNNVEVEDEDSDLEEIKMQIIVKSKNIKVPIAKTLNIEPASYENVMEKVNLIVQKTLREKITSKDYVISYKVVNVHGPSNELKDELDFQRFIGEYKRIILDGKKMAMIVAVRDNLTKKKKLHNEVKFLYNILCNI